MTSKIVVNNIEADAGVSTVTVIGDCQATTFKGDGSNLTSLPSQATIANNADNRVITGGSGVNLNGEANLTFNGETLNVNGGSTDTPLIVDTTSANGSHMRFQKDAGNKHFVGSGGGFGLGDIDDLAFRTVDNLIFGVGTSEKLRIESGGDVKVATGDIYFATAGKGIVLGTTSNTDAHTLDHYQEGTTGLVVKCGSVTVPLLNNTCKWTRVGNVVNVSAWIRISGGTSASGISATDPVKITGFPFATSGNSAGRTRLVFTGYTFSNVANASALWGWMVVGDGATSTEHELHWGNANWSGLIAPDGNNITNGGNYASSEIYLNGHMFV